LARDRRDRVRPGIARVERWHETKTLAAVRSPVGFGADADLLQRLEAIGDERGNNNHGSPHAAPGCFADLDVREGTDPRRAPEPGLKADDTLSDRDVERFAE